MKTKDELLIENIILKQSEHTRKLLKEELSPLKKEIAGLDNRLSSAEDQLTEIQETLKPFTAFRKGLWKRLVYFVFGLGLALFTYAELLKREVIK